MQDMNAVIRTMSNVQTSTSSDWRQLQLEGNLRYKLGEHLTAAVAYTKSLSLTQPHEAARAQLLATRSAVLLAAGRFADAVRDAERALDRNYPGPMRFRLHLRIALCKRQLGDVDAAQSQLQAARSSILASGFPDEEQTQLLAAVDKAYEAPAKVQQKAVEVSYEEPPQLSYGAKRDWPCLSSAVEVKSNTQFGRHLVAAQDLQTGDVLVREDPAVYGLKNDSQWSHCSYCLKINFALYPCDHCSKELYCSDECQSAAWTHHHHVVCAAQKKFEEEFRQEYDLSENIFTSFKRIFAFLSFFGVENCLNYREPDFCPADPERMQLLRQFLQLVHHAPPYADEIVSLSSKILVNCFGFEDEKKVARLAEFCSLALLKHNANSFSIEECFVYAPTDEFDLKHIGFGSYHTAALANHSCDPNLVCTFYRKTMICRAIRPVKKGEQLFGRYCNSFYNLPKEVRREKLRQYNFECSCEACEHDWPVAKAMPEAPLSVCDNVLADELRALVRKESLNSSGLAIDYRHLASDETLHLCHKLQQAFLQGATDRLNRLYRTVEMVIFYHWAIITKSYQADNILA